VTPVAPAWAGRDDKTLRRAALGEICIKIFAPIGFTAVPRGLQL
jgi:hypothetical protein